MQAGDTRTLDFYVYLLDDARIELYDDDVGSDSLIGASYALGEFVDVDGWPTRWQPHPLGDNTLELAESGKYVLSFALEQNPGFVHGAG